MLKKSLTVEVPDNEHLENVKLQSMYDLPESVLLSLGSNKIAISISDLELAIADIKSFTKSTNV